MTSRLVFALAAWMPMLAQPGGIIRSGNVVDSSHGVVNYALTYETRLEPPTPPIAGNFGGGAMTGSDGMHRLVMDTSRRAYFGYDLAVEKLPEANTFRVTIRPLSVSLEKMMMVDTSGWTVIPLPGYPAPQTVHGGDTIALDLFSNAATGQKIVEYIKFRDMSQPAPKKKREGTERRVAGGARDFSVADAEFQIMEPRVKLNGKALPITENFKGGVVGAAAWFYVPDHGRYVLSLQPLSHLGFVKAGEVRGNALTLTVGGDTITFECNERIASGNAPYNLYVLYDPAWRPKSDSNRNAFLMGTAESAESILRK